MDDCFPADYLGVGRVWLRLFRRHPAKLVALDDDRIELHSGRRTLFPLANCLLAERSRFRGDRRRKSRAPRVYSISHDHLVDQPALFNRNARPTPNGTVTAMVRVSQSPPDSRIALGTLHPRNCACRNTNATASTVNAPVLKGRMRETKEIAFGQYSG